MMIMRRGLASARRARPVAILCVARAVPLNPLEAEEVAVDWITSACPEGVYATVTSVGNRQRLHGLSARCDRLAQAAGVLKHGELRDTEISAASSQYAASLRQALIDHSTAVKSLPGREFTITMHAAAEDEVVRILVQPSPVPPAPPLDAEFSPPLDHRRRDPTEVHRGADGSWRTPLVHPTLNAADKGADVEERLLRDHHDRIIEGLNSNFFVVCGEGKLWTAAEEEGAYGGSVRAAVLRLARTSGLFSDVIERAPTAHGLGAGEWQEAWLTCMHRRVAPLARIHDGNGWVALAGSERGERMRVLLDEEMVERGEEFA